jgi:RNA polymerase sigma factor (TIGR02999 family)
MSLPDFTTLLIAWRDGDQSVTEQIVTMVYDELRLRARKYLSSESGYQTLSPTALVNETFVRLLGGSQVEWKCRAHFFFVASKQMRRILIDYARHRQVRNRGDRRWSESVWSDEASSPFGFLNNQIDLLALNEALNELAEIFPRAAEIVEMKYFGGLTEQEIAEVLQISPATIKRDWAMAKTWLFGKLNSASSDI